MGTENGHSFSMSHAHSTVTVLYSYQSYASSTNLYARAAEVDCCSNRPNIPKRWANIPGVFDKHTIDVNTYCIHVYDRDETILYVLYGYSVY